MIPMITISFKENEPETFTIDPDEIREAVIADFKERIEPESKRLTARKAERLKALGNQVFESCDLAGRLIFLSPAISDGVLLSPLKAGERGLLYVLFVRDHKGLKASLTRMFDRYYYEIWGGALISQGIRAVDSAVKKAAADRGLLCSSSVCPGTEGFPLDAQRTIFRLLEPEDLGIRLLDSCLMAPENAFTALYAVNG